MKQYNDDIFELYLDPTTDYQIKLRLKNFTPPASGNIDMTSMTADEAQLTIRAAVAAGFTDLKLTGELSKTGIGGNWGTFINNKKITKCDLTGVTGWGTTPTLPELAFVNCTALQEVTLPDDVRVIGSSAFFGCAALTTVNLSQVTWINLNAFWGCTSLETLALDNVTEIGRETFYGCTSLKTLKIPKCTRFGNYIVTGCKALTRIEATATGDFADLSGDDVGIERTAVFHNSDSHSGDSAFNPAKCQVTYHAELEIERAILCCKSYHARRCLMYYQLLYPKTEFYVVPVNADGITRENWRKNEEGIDAVTGELSRIVKQFSLMLER